MATAGCHRGGAACCAHTRTTLGSIRSGSNDAGLRKIRVVLLLHVGEREAELRAVRAATPVQRSRGRVQADAVTDHVAEVLSLHEQLAAPLVDDRGLAR